MTDKKKKDHLKVVSSNGNNTSSNNTEPPDEWTYEDELVDVYAYAFEVLIKHSNKDLGLACLWKVREAITEALNPLSNIDYQLFKEAGYETD